MDPEHHIADEARHNFTLLKEIVDSGLARTSQTKDAREAKNILIEVQNHFRGLKLYREDRESLYGRLQEAFAAVNKRIDDERQAYEAEVSANYSLLKALTGEALIRSKRSSDLREMWDHLLDIQVRIKAAKLFRDQRDELFGLLQEAFSTVKQQRDQERTAFEQETQRNYIRLKGMVEDGLKQAELTHEYKETREYLKKIQSEFRGIRMVHEQREELYSRLQTAFDTLGRRLDEFFRTKKKNWEVKMQYRLSQYGAEIYELQEKLSQDQAYLQELEDQLAIITSAGRETPAKPGLEARIGSTRKSIIRRSEEIARLEQERSELVIRLEGEPE